MKIEDMKIEGEFVGKVFAGVGRVGKRKDESCLMRWGLLNLLNKCIKLLLLF